MTCHVSVVIFAKVVKVDISRLFAYLEAVKAWPGNLFSKVNLPGHASALIMQCGVQGTCLTRKRLTAILHRMEHTFQLISI